MISFYKIKKLVKFLYFMMLKEMICSLILVFMLFYLSNQIKIGTNYEQ